MTKDHFLREGLVRFGLAFFAVWECEQQLNRRLKGAAERSIATLSKASRVRLNCKDGQIKPGDPGDDCELILRRIWCLEGSRHGDWYYYLGWPGGQDSGRKVVFGAHFKPEDVHDTDLVYRALKRHHPADDLLSWYTGPRLERELSGRVETLDEEMDAIAEAWAETWRSAGGIPGVMGRQ